MSGFQDVVPVKPLVLDLACGQDLAIISLYFLIFVIITTIFIIIIENPDTLGWLLGHSLYLLWPYKFLIRLYTFHGGEQ